MSKNLTIDDTYVEAFLASLKLESLDEKKIVGVIKSVGEYFTLSVKLQKFLKRNINSPLKVLLTENKKLAKIPNEKQGGNLALSLNQTRALIREYSKPKGQNLGFFKKRAGLTKPEYPVILKKSTRKFYSKFKKPKNKVNKSPTPGNGLETLGKTPLLGKNTNHPTSTKLRQDISQPRKKVYERFHDYIMKSFLYKLEIRKSLRNKLIIKDKAINLADFIETSLKDTNSIWNLNEKCPSEKQLSKNLGVSLVTRFTNKLLENKSTLILKDLTNKVISKLNSKKIITLTVTLPIHPSKTYLKRILYDFSLLYNKINSLIKVESKLNSNLFSGIIIQSENYDLNTTLKVRLGKFEDYIGRIQS
jgi:F0F1-type ATP synthase delta subunit